MLTYEWKKLLFYRRGLWFILAFLLASLVLTLFFTQPYDAVLEDNREVYESYLAPVIGPLTPEKRESLEKEMERLNQVHRDMEQLKRDYYSGSLVEEEYRAGFDRLLADDSRYTGFSKLYSQYIFVREQENRAFLYAGGWESLLTNQSPNYLLLLLLVILLAPVFCEEYSSRMQEILLTQKRSARRQAGIKIFVALALTAALTAAAQGIELGYCALKFGLSHGEFPLQSLQSFGNAEKELSLWQAFWLQFGLKEIGYCYAAVCILFFSVLLKKYALSLMAGISFLALPFLTVENADVFLPIPAPWALTLGSIYLNGSKIAADSQTGEQVIKVAELPLGELAALLAAAGLLCAGMLLFIRRKNTNHQLLGLRKGAAITALLLAVMSLSGCAEAKEPISYNSTSAAWCESEKFMLMRTPEGAVLTEKSSGKSYTFPTDAFVGEIHFASRSFYCIGGYAYYIKETQLHPYGGYDDTIAVSYLLMEVDLKTLSERVYYQWNTEEDWFFGLLEKDSGEADPGRIGSFFLHKNSLFYVDERENSLCRMDLTTGQPETYLQKLEAWDIAYDGQTLYYADAYNRLVLHNLDTREEQAVDGVVMKTFLLSPEGLYFLNRRDGNCLYHWDAESGIAVKLGNITGSKLYCTAQSLWLLDEEAGFLQRISYDGSQSAAIRLEGSLCGVSEGGSIYYVKSDNTICLLGDYVQSD